MFGKNPIQKQELGDGRKLRVVKGSPFFTIQGEGPFAGHPAVFVRLHGCNLRCWFCDTEFSNPDDPEWDTTMLARAILDEQIRYRRQFKLVVITGGEPFRQNITKLCKMLLGYGFTVQIETAGSLWVPGLEELLGPVHGNRFRIVCSPKTPTIHEMVLKHATEFKYVVGSDTEIINGVPAASTQNQNGVARPLAVSRSGTPVYLSPMDEYDEEVNAHNRRKVAQLALKHGFIAGVQMHKLMEIQEP